MFKKKKETTETLKKPRLTLIKQRIRKYNYMTKNRFKQHTGNLGPMKYHLEKCYITPEENMIRILGKLLSSQTFNFGSSIYQRN